eukprot:2890178-Prymnesium_polylepis.1
MVFEARKLVPNTSVQHTRFVDRNDRVSGGALKACRSTIGIALAALALPLAFVSREAAPACERSTFGLSRASWRATHQPSASCCSSATGVHRAGDGPHPKCCASHRKQARARARPNRRCRLYESR